MNEAPTKPNPTHERTAVLVVSIIAVVAMCAFIFAMSAKPAVESDEISLGVVAQFISIIVPGYDQMSPDDQYFWQHSLNYVVRKTAHFLEYAALGALTINMLYQIARWRGREIWLVGLAGMAWSLATLYACSDEAHQLFVTGRSGQVTDVLVDSCGVLFGVMLVFIGLLSARKKRE